VICNFAPVLRTDFRVGLPQGGRWREVFNSDATDYGGTGQGNGGYVTSEGDGWHGQPVSASLTLPPLATLILTPDG
jgi:1,4-alpha-glucan branching enzyme